MPLIHWPDNMLTYDAEAKIVFSNDAFGQHIVSFKLFDEAHDLSFCLDKAKEYSLPTSSCPMAHRSVQSCGRSRR